MKIFSNLIKHGFLTLLGACMILAPHLHAQTPQQKVDSVLALYLQTAGGINCAVIDAEGNITAGSNGVSTLGGFVTDSTFFGVSNFSQHLMAALTLKLVENGSLALSDQLGSGVLVGVNPANYPSTTTIEQLLRHESGINDFASSPTFMDATSFIFGDLTFDFGTINYQPTLSQFVDPLGAPGMAGTFDYSSTNYLVLGEKLEQLTQRSLQKLMDSVLLGPLGITDVKFWPVSDSALLARSSSFYFNLNGTGAVRLNSQNSVLTTTGAAGGFVATPRAILTYMKELFAGNVLNANSLGLLTNFQSISGRLSDAYSYGTERFAFNVNGVSQTYIGHAGNLNFKTVVAYSADNNFGVVTMSNNFETTDTTMFELAEDLLAAIGAGTVNNEKTVEVQLAKVFPNPGKGLIQFEMESKRPGNLWVEVYNMEGQRVLSQKSLASTTAHQLKLDLQALPSGTYLLRGRVNEEIAVAKFQKR